MPRTKWSFRPTWQEPKHLRLLRRWHNPWTRRAILIWCPEKKKIIWKKKKKFNKKIIILENKKKRKVSKTINMIFLNLNVSAIMYNRFKFKCDKLFHLSASQLDYRCFIFKKIFDIWIVKWCVIIFETHLELIKSIFPFKLKLIISIKLFQH